MADKLRKTFPIKITTVPGEQPSAQKITAIALQARNGLGIIESAVGDIWNQSGDLILGDNDSFLKKFLCIPNLGRMIGPSSTLSAMLDPIDSNGIRFVDYIGASESVDVNSFALHLPPDSDTIVSASGTPLTTLKSDVRDVRVAGDYYYDSNSKKVFAFSPVENTNTITYDVSEDGWPTDSNFSQNVIPPREQDSNVKFSGCKVVSKGETGKYYLYLPPRMRINQSVPKKKRVFLGGMNIAADADNDSTDLTNLGYFWGNTTTAPSVAEDHYRYKFPAVIDFSSRSEGERLPDGFIRLWNETEKRVIDSIAFYKPASPYNSYSFIVEIDAPLYVTELDALATTHADETESAYSTPIKLIVGGTSISEQIDFLRAQLSTHTHSPVSGDISDRSFASSTARIKHDLLTELDPPSGALSPFALVKSLAIPLTKSSWTADGHLQYLHRAGSRASDGALKTSERDIYNNAFLGDFLIGSSTKGSTGFFHNESTSDSFKIYFGRVGTDTPALYHKYSVGLATNTLSVANKPLTIEQGELFFRHPDNSASLPNRRLFLSSIKEDNILSLLNAASGTATLGTAKFAAGSLVASKSVSHLVSDSTEYSELGDDALTFYGTDAKYINSNSDLTIKTEVDSGKDLVIYGDNSLSINAKAGKNINIGGASENKIYLKTNTEIQGNLEITGSIVGSSFNVSGTSNLHTTNVTTLNAIGDINATGNITGNNLYGSACHVKQGSGTQWHISPYDNANLIFRTATSSEYWKYLATFKSAGGFTFRDGVSAVTGVLADLDGSGNLSIKGNLSVDGDIGCITGDFAYWGASGAVADQNYTPSIGAASTWYSAAFPYDCIVTVNIWKYTSTVFLPTGSWGVRTVSAVDKSFGSFLVDNSNYTTISFAAKAGEKFWLYAALGWIVGWRLTIAIRKVK